MFRTLEALLDEDGELHFLESIDLPKKQYRALVTILEEHVGPQPELRPYGLCAGQFAVPENFDASLPAEVRLNMI